MLSDFRIGGASGGEACNSSAYDELDDRVD